ncbi:DMT family transporter [Aquibium sp. A9E412]|uniref:DMT family transporter n=1 Tax=Aquibium sp. A9E412 TaxID=2976767 RepID=UPI0025B1FFA5|nr:DMT family transporter [Aquibium sp. A9E412]MDN2567309.1 DMT family transporter [Aquibium sp. A9E412]
MSEPRTPLTPSSALLLVIVFAAFGGQQTAVKLAVGDIGPVLQAALRSAGGALLLAVWFVVRRKNPFAAPVALSVVLGLLFAVDFGLLYVGIALTAASHATVLYYTAPMMIALAAMTAIADEPFDRRKIAGIGIAFAGVAAVALVRPAGGAAGATLLGDALCLGAAAAWALTVLVIRGTRLKAVDASVVLFHQLFWSIPVLAIVALAAGETAAIGWSGPALGALAFQTVAVAFAGYLVFFRLIQRHPASQVSAMSFLAPLFGVLSAWAILGEALTPGLAAGAAAILAGLFLTNRSGAARRG